MDSSTGRGWPVGIVMGGVLCFIAAIYIFRGLIAERSFLRADGLELLGSLQAWETKGQPHGEALSEFLQGQRPDLVVTNKALVIHNRVYFSQFAATKLRSGSGGVLFVTTNGTLILQKNSGSLLLVPLNIRPLVPVRSGSNSSLNPTKLGSCYTIKRHIVSSASVDARVKARAKLLADENKGINGSAIRAT